MGMSEWLEKGQRKAEESAARHEAKAAEALQLGKTDKAEYEQKMAEIDRKSAAKQAQQLAEYLAKDTKRRTDNAERQAAVSVKLGEDVTSETTPREDNQDLAVGSSTKAEKKAAKEAAKAEKRAAVQAREDAQKAEKTRLKKAYGHYYANFLGKEGNAGLKDGYVRIGAGLVTKVSIEHVSVQLVGQGSTGQMKAGRVVAGAVLAGPVGAVIGGMAKKEKAGTWIVIADSRTGASGQVPVLSSEIPQAVKFIAKVEAAQQAAQNS